MASAAELQLRRVEDSPPTEVPRFWTVRELAGRLSVSRVWIFELYRRGRLRGCIVGREPGATRGGRLLFTESEVLRFLRECGVELEDAPDA